jgi:ubiquinone/menaquinone biosynthesis C-methylase UbiE
MDHRQSKYENPTRLAELNPPETLRRLGLMDGDVVCDIGAGSGLFSIPAAQLTRAAVYALDIDDGMLAIIRDKAAQAQLPNISTVRVHGLDLGVDAGSVDIALLVTVLHEVPDRTAFVKSVAGLLKPRGKVAVIEFHKRETPLGPPMSIRLSRDEIAADRAAAGLELAESYDLGENLWCAMFREQR